MLTLFLIFALPWWAGALCLLLPRGRNIPRRWVLAIPQGVGLVALAVLPAAIAQPFVQRSTSFDPLETLLPMVAVPGVHAGGLTVRLLFEPIAESGVFGHRHATMLSNWPVFWTLAMAQTLAGATLVAARLRRRDRRRLAGAPRARLDPVVLVVLGAFLLNAALNLRWPWWGT